MCSKVKQVSTAWQRNKHPFWHFEAGNRKMMWSDVHIVWLMIHILCTKQLKYFVVLIVQNLLIFLAAKISNPHMKHTCFNLQISQFGFDLLNYSLCNSQCCLLSGDQLFPLFNSRVDCHCIQNTANLTAPRNANTHVTRYPACWHSFS